MFDTPDKNKLNIYIGYLFHSSADFIFYGFSLFFLCICRSWWAGLQDLAEQATRPKARSRRRRPFVVSVYFQQTGKSSCVMKLVLKVETLPAAGV